MHVFGACYAIGLAPHVLVKDWIPVAWCFLRSFGVSLVGFILVVPTKRRFCLASLAILDKPWLLEVWHMLVL